MWISADETYQWARSWPCSELSGHRIRASFDSCGLFDLAIDGREAPDVAADELSACVADHVAQRLAPEHPCYFVAVGQFRGGDVDAMEKPIPRCLVCGEETTHNRDSSWFGHVHRFGPKDHEFRSDQ